MKNSSENFSFPIPNEVLEPYIRQAVGTAITAALGSEAILIDKAIKAALGEKVDSQGRVSRSSYENTHMLVEVVAAQAIRKIAVETINEMAEQMRPQIHRQVTEFIQGQTSEISRALVDGMIKSLQSSWSVKVKICGDE